MDVFYQSSDYVLTGEYQFMLAGNAPFIVRVDDGAIHTSGTAHPVEHNLKQYESGHWPRFR